MSTSPQGPATPRPITPMAGPPKRSGMKKASAAASHADDAELPALMRALSHPLAVVTYKMADLKQHTYVALAAPV